MISIKDLGHERSEISKLDVNFQTIKKFSFYPTIDIIK